VHFLIMFQSNNVRCWMMIEVLRVVKFFRISGFKNNLFRNISVASKSADQENYVCLFTHLQKTGELNPENKVTAIEIEFERLIRDMSWKDEAGKRASGRVTGSP